MATKIGALNLEDAEEAQLWIISFEAKCRSKTLEDGNNKFPCMDLFLTDCGIQALKKIKYLVQPKLLTDLAFNDVKRKILEYLQPKEKLVIAERTRFLEEKQLPDEPINMYYARLKKSAQYCKFNDLKGEDDMLLLKLISGIYQMEMKRKVLEANQSDKMDLDTTIEFIKNLEQIGKYTHKQEETMEYVDKNKESNKFRKSSNPTTCGYCGRIHIFRLVEKYATNVKEKTTLLPNVDHKMHMR